MIRDWRHYKLDELGLVSRGRSRHRPRNAPHLYGGKYPFIQTADVKAANLYITNYSQTYSDAGLTQSKIWEPGTLCITIAANIADTAILGISACFPDSIIGFVPYKDKSDARYIKYYFDIFQKTFQQISQGATQDNLSAEKLLGMKIPAPPLPTQQKIASILSAYDDLIENNLKRIKLLEEMAQITYEEWFVRLRFPGYESTPINSSTGLPEGWKIKKLGEVTSLIKRGISPLYVESNGVAVINQKCIRSHRVDLSVARQTSKSKKIPNEKLLKKYDVLVNSTGTGTLGRVAQYFFENVVTTVDSHVTIVRACPSISPLYLGRFLERNESCIEQLGKGATNQKELSASDMASVIDLIIPTRELEARYQQYCEYIFGEVSSLSAQNILLREARDILLPRLMTGKIDVESYNPADLLKEVA